jgi:hypothetical protein
VPSGIAIRIRLGRSGSAELMFFPMDTADRRRQVVRPSSICAADGASRSSALAWHRPVLDEVLVLVMDAAIEATGAERGFIMLSTPNGSWNSRSGGLADA